MKKIFSIFVLFFYLLWPLYAIDYQPYQVIVWKVARTQEKYISQYNRFERLNIDDLEWNIEINTSIYDNNLNLKNWDLVVFFAEKWVTKDSSVKIDCTIWFYESLKKSIFFEVGWWLIDKTDFVKTINCENIQEQLHQNGIFYWLDHNSDLLEDIKWIKKQNQLMKLILWFIIIWWILIIILKKWKK